MPGAAAAHCPLTPPPRSSQASCGPESSGSELAPAAPAPRMLQGLLGSDDEEQEDPKDYCKGEAWPRAWAARWRPRDTGAAGEEEGAAAGPRGPWGRRGWALRGGGGHPGRQHRPPRRSPCRLGSLRQAATTP